MQEKFKTICGNSLDVLKQYPDNYFDSVVTDPPYGLSFMGKKWDYDVPSVDIWKEVFRVLKPGGHLLAFAGTRTQHRMAVNIEDAGFEIRDMIAWVYGSGFPKSLDVSKAIDKKAGQINQSVIDLKKQLIDLVNASGMTRSDIDAACGFRATNYLTLPSDNKKHDPWVNILPSRDKWEIMKTVLGTDDSLDKFFTHAEREIIGVKSAIPGVAFSSEGPTEIPITAPATDEAKKWQGWGTALKPALEPITVARKPIIGTVVDNVLTHGTGAINIDGCRVSFSKNDDARISKNYAHKSSPQFDPINGKLNSIGEEIALYKDSGRWPANFIHDGSDEVISEFPELKSAGQVRSADEGTHSGTDNAIYSPGLGGPAPRYGDTGSAARFFYCAKASKKDREDGNNHPTVKPTDLMRYLCRLVTPPNGIVLDPFMGSGSTGKAAMLEGFRFVGIDLSEEYVKIANARIANTSKPNKKTQKTVVESISEQQTEIGGLDIEI